MNSPEHSRIAALTSLAGLALALGASTPASAQAIPEGLRWPSIAADHLRLKTISLLGVPTFRLGKGPGTDSILLAGVLGGVRFASGAIVIADAGNARLVRFDRSGLPTGSVGRTGDGPGEFRLPRWFGRCTSGETAVFDASHLRVTYFDSTLQVVRFLSVPAGLNFDRILSCSGSDRLLMLRNHGGLVVHPGFSSVRTVLVRIEGKRVDTLATLGHQDYYFARGSPAFSGVPLGRSTLAATSTGLVFLCTSQEGECQLFDSTGTRLGTFSLNLPRLPVSSSDWSIVLQTYPEAEPLPRIRRRLDSVLTEIPKPGRFPAIDRIQADAAGRLWVRTYDNFATGVATWVVVTAAGTPVARVAAPRGFQILEIGNDYVLGFTRDPDGVEEVELYRYPPR